MVKQAQEYALSYYGVAERKHHTAASATKYGWPEDSGWEGESNDACLYRNGRRGIMTSCFEASFGPRVVRLKPAGSLCRRTLGQWPESRAP